MTYQKGTEEMLKMFIVGALFAGLLFVGFKFIVWDMRTTCAARWAAIGETEWSRTAQCRVKIDGVFVPEDNVIFDSQRSQ